MTDEYETYNAKEFMRMFPKTWGSHIGIVLFPHRSTPAYILKLEFGMIGGGNPFQCVIGVFHSEAIALEYQQRYSQLVREIIADTTRFIEGLGDATEAEIVTAQRILKTMMKGDKPIDLDKLRELNSR